jgi:hypothetical protein
MGPSPHADKEGGGQALSGILKIKMPASIQGPDLVFLGMEEAPVIAQKDFVDMPLLHVSPTRLLVTGPKEFLGCDKALLVRH